MAEQFANLAETTLANSYVAGSGKIVVVSASGFPLSGTFSVLILNGATSILIFRVTSVNGTTFNGAAEGTDANAQPGYSVIGTMLTAAAMTQIEADVRGLNIYTNQNPLPLTNYTWQNQGNANYAAVGSRTMAITLPGDNATNVLHALLQSVPATPYTVHMGMNVPPGFASNYNLTGLCISDGTKYIFIGYSPSKSTVYVQETATLTSTPSSIANYGPDMVKPYPGYNYIYFKISDDGTNLTWSFSTDSYSWLQVYQAPRTAYVTSVAYMGIIWYNQSPTPLTTTIFDFGTAAQVAT